MPEEDLEKDFNEIYENEIEPKIKSLEAQRLTKKRIHDFLFVLVIILSIVLVFMSKIMPSSIDGFEFANARKILYLVCCFCIFCLFGVLNKIENKFRNNIKKAFLNPMLSYFGNFHICEKSSLSMGKIRGFGLYKKSLRKIDDDVIKGEYNNFNIEITDTTIYHWDFFKNFYRLSTRVDSVSKVLDFSGLILKLNIDNDIPICVIKKRKEGNDNLKKKRLLVRFFDPFQNKNVMKFLNSFEIDDKRFNYEYEMYGIENYNSVSLLTPSFIESVKTIEKKILTKCESIVFEGKNLYLFLDKKPYVSDSYYNDSKFSFFEIGDVYSTLYDKTRFEEVFCELSDIFSAIRSFYDESEGRF